MLLQTNHRVSKQPFNLDVAWQVEDLHRQLKLAHTSVKASWTSPVASFLFFGTDVAATMVEE